MLQAQVVAALRPSTVEYEENRSHYFCCSRNNGTLLLAVVIQCRKATHCDGVKRNHLCSLCGPNVPKQPEGLGFAEFLETHLYAHKTH